MGGKGKRGGEEGREEGRGEANRKCLAVVGFEEGAGWEAQRRGGWENFKGVWICCDDGVGTGGLGIWGKKGG